MPPVGHRLDETGKKVCSVCHEPKLAVLFPRNAKCVDGLSSWCLGCFKEYSRAYRARLKVNA